MDLIHSHLPMQNFYSCLVGRLPDVRRLRHTMVPLSWSNRRRLRGTIQFGLVKRSADAVVVVCDFVREMLRESGFPAEKIERIHNGIDSDRFHFPVLGD